MSSVGFRFQFLSVVLAFSALPLLSQSGTVQGRVVDPAAAVIANCPVQAVDDAKAVVVRETMTSSDGTFKL